MTMSVLCRNCTVESTLDAFDSKRRANYLAFVESLKDSQAPAGVELKIGDLVTFHNEFGIGFENLEIIGFSDTGAFVTTGIDLQWSSYWMPKAFSRLEKQGGVL